MWHMKNYELWRNMIDKWIHMKYWRNMEYEKYERWRNMKYEDTWNMKKYDTWINIIRINIKKWMRYKQIWHLKNYEIWRNMTYGLCEIWIF